MDFQDLRLVYFPDRGVQLHQEDGVVLDHLVAAEDNPEEGNLVEEDTLAWSVDPIGSALAAAAPVAVPHFGQEADKKGLYEVHIPELGSLEVVSAVAYNLVVGLADQVDPAGVAVPGLRAGSNLSEDIHLEVRTRAAAEDNQGVDLHQGAEVGCLVESVLTRSRLTVFCHWHRPQRQSLKSF